MIIIKKLVLFILTLAFITGPSAAIANETSNVSNIINRYDAYLAMAEESEDTSDNESDDEEDGSEEDGEEEDTPTPTTQEDVENPNIHEPVLPDGYDDMELDELPEEGEQVGHQPNTLIVNDFLFNFEDLRGNVGYGDDFEELNRVLDENRVTYVGMDNVHTFFGHYYDLSGTGVFNPLADMDLLNEGSEVIVTDEDGYSKGYLVTQTIEFLYDDQFEQFYGDAYMPEMAYYGVGEESEEMVYIQYCRWDIQTGLLITNVGYRVW